MAYEYLLHAECGVQAKRKPEEVMRLSKNRDAIAYFEQHRDMLLAKNPGRKFDQIPIVGMIAGKRMETTIGKMRKDWEKCTPVAARECPDCPLNFRGRLVGCYGAVNYPLPAALERWWIEHFAPAPERGCAVLGIIEEFQLEGGEIDARRPGPGEPANTFFEASRPAVGRLAAFDRSLSSSQFIELLWTVKYPPADLLWSLCVDFGAIAGPDETIVSISGLLAPPLLGIVVSGDDVTFVNEEISDELQRAASGPHSDEDRARFEREMQTLRFCLEPEARDDPAVAGFKIFLLACWTALRQGSSMYTDG